MAGEKIIFTILILFIGACSEKDELTLPVRVNYRIGIEQPGSVEIKLVEFMPDNMYSESFDFTEGEIGIQKIQFEGQRETGGDVFFETDPRINYQVKFAPNKYIAEQQALISSFDLPQGIYNNMKWNIYLNSIVTDDYVEANDADLQNVGLVIHGCFRKAWYYVWDFGILDSVYVIPFLFIVDDTEQFSIMSYHNSSNSSIVLSENTAYNAVFSLNLPYAFETISGESFEAADISGDDLNKKVIISSNTNKNLYEIILYRLAISSSVFITK